MQLALDENTITRIMRDAFKVRTLRNDTEYALIDGKGLTVAIDTITASSDIPKGMRLYDAARKSVVACVSDFAAKGIKPQFGVVTITIPSSFTVKSTRDLASGIASAAKKFDLKILGGDTSFGELSISVCLFGYSKNPVGRDGAKIGDGIFATGWFGYSAAGLHLALSRKKPIGLFEIRAKKAFCTPNARLEFGIAASKHFSSSIDSSDGLAESLYELAQASGKQFLLEKIPTPLGLVEFAKKYRVKSNDLLFYGGEEYELVFTVPQKQWSIIHRLAIKHRVSLTRIGTVRSGKDIYLKHSSKTTKIFKHS
ncbi:MAG: thiamine-monophosphate kinase (thiL) [Cenarchaeum symbiont of Oopsacas minuta]|nr:thiamine-monophosphate kinase (thiL) [Cenarchaeum symbiont of Oopsacas minuta]